MQRTIIRPYSRPWYKRAWGVFALACIFVIFTLSLASAIYVFTVYSRLKSGKISLEDIFGVSGAQTTKMIYGDNRPVLGNREAPIVFAVFMDYECPFCKDASRVINTLLLDENYKTRVKFVIRHFPVTALHPNALTAAMAVECAYSLEKFAEMHNALFDAATPLTKTHLKRIAKLVQLDTDAFNKCLETQKFLSIIEKDMTDGITIGITSTPGFVIGDRILEGAPTLEELKKAVDLLYTSSTS